MKRYAKWMIAVLLVAFAAPLLAADRVQVQGYTRKDGTFVQPYYRSAPDKSFNNNWSTKGNINPYTGKAGTVVTPPSSGGMGGYRLPATPGYTPRQNSLTPFYLRRR